MAKERLNVTKSFRLDALSLSLCELDGMNRPRDILEALSAFGYEVREPKETDVVRKAKGFDVLCARMICIDGGWYTLQLKMAKRNGDEFPSRGFIAFSGEDLDNVDVRSFLLNLGSVAKATRADVTLDLTFPDNCWGVSRMESVQSKLCRLAGFVPEYKDGNVQGAHSLRAGRINKRHPISTASKTASNGLTLYIGGRQSRFMLRFYDKAAEVARRTGKVIPPTLRCEVEVKKEESEAVRKYICEVPDFLDKCCEILWQNLCDDNLSFDVDGVLKSVGATIGVGTAIEKQLDYSAVEGRKLEFDRWVKTQVAPSYGRFTADMSDTQMMSDLIHLMCLDEKRASRLLEIFGVGFVHEEEWKHG